MSRKIDVPEIMTAKPALHKFALNFPTGSAVGCMIKMDGKPIFPNSLRFEAQAGHLCRITLEFDGVSAEIDGNAEALAVLREQGAVIDFTEDDMFHDGSG